MPWISFFLHGRGHNPRIKILIFDRNCTVTCSVTPFAVYMLVDRGRSLGKKHKEAAKDVGLSCPCKTGNHSFQITLVHNCIYLQTFNYFHLLFFIWQKDSREIVFRTFMCSVHRKWVINGKYFLFKETIITENIVIVLSREGPSVWILLGKIWFFGYQMMNKREQFTYNHTSNCRFFSYQEEETIFPSSFSTNMLT